MARAPGRRPPPRGRFVTHPTVTVAAPGTGDPEHMIENLGAAGGRMPTEEHRRRMVELMESLPGG